MKLIVTSEKDIASMNMLKIFLEKYEFVETGKYRSNPSYSFKDFKIITINEELIEATYLNKDFPNAEIVIFASRHSSSSKLKSLTVHTDGNWCEAKFGGDSNKISFSNAIYNSTALKRLLYFKEEYRLKEYKVSFEVTHHGPSIDLPTVWVEVGGSEEEWKDLKACEAVVDTIISLDELENFKEIGIGIGGPHYAPKFTRFVLENDIAIGHIIPKYVFDCIPDYMFLEAVKRTLPKVDKIFVDRKGTKKERRERIKEIYKEFEIEFI